MSRIEEDGPGEAAGLRQGDLILSFDGERVRESRTFPRMVAESEIGREVEVEIIRRDRRMTLDITVGELEREGDEDAAAGSGSAGGVVNPLPGQCQ